MIACILLPTLLFSAVSGRPDWIPSLRPPQAVGVRGKLTCNGEPAADILVKLYDHDSKHVLEVSVERSWVIFLFIFVMMYSRVRRQDPVPYLYP